MQRTVMVHYQVQTAFVGLSFIYSIMHGIGTKKKYPISLLQLKDQITGTCNTKMNLFPLQILMGKTS
jgi:hypothetical protein